MNWLSRAHVLVSLVIQFEPIRPLRMGQNKAAGSTVKKQMGHYPYEVSTLKNNGESKNSMEINISKTNFILTALCASEMRQFKTIT